MEQLQTKWLALLHILIILFGVSAWLGVNSTYVQLPLLVENAPEGWSLPSFIVIAIQCGNIGPLLYTLLQKRKYIRDSMLIAIVLLIGVIAAFLFGFLYDRTWYVFGRERSVPIFILVFAIAIVGCTSSVLFMPYMGRFKEIYLVTYLIGEGASGFVPSIIALGQGVGGNTVCVASNASSTGYEEYTPPPRFNIQIFYNIICIISLVSFVAFLLLELLPHFKHEYSAVTITEGNHYSYEETHHDSKLTLEQPKILSTFNYTYLLLLLGMVCTLVNGVLPSIQSYSCLPYGNVAYHLAVTLSQMANPLACFLAFFLPHKSIRTITSLALISIIFVVYAFVTALIDSPPFNDNYLGITFIVISWVAIIGLHSFIRLAITAIFRQQGGRSLVWVGSMTQVGSFIGSFVAFILINFTNLFRQHSACERFSN